MKSKELQRPRSPPSTWGTQAMPVSQRTPVPAGPSPDPLAHLSLLPGEERSAGPIQHLQKGSEGPPHVDSRSSPAVHLPWGSLLQVPAVGAAHRAARRRWGSAGGGLSRGDGGTPRQSGVFLTCCWLLRGGSGELAVVGPRRHGAGHSVLPAPCAGQKPSNRIPLLLARSPRVLSKSP